MSEEDKKEARPLQHAHLANDVKLTVNHAGKEEIIDEYCQRIAEVIPHLKSLNKNELYRILMTLAAPPFLLGDKMPWKLKNRKEESIANHLFGLDDLKIALVEVISLEREAIRNGSANEKEVESNEQVSDRSGDDGTKLQEG